MKIAEITRHETSEQGTIGLLKIDKQVFCFTMEPPDRQNAQNISCIPPGQYICKRVKSPRFGNTFEITNVPGRSYILFHWGNTRKDTLGCVMLGNNPGSYGGERGISSSKSTFREFMYDMDGVEEFHLTIKEDY